MNITPRISQNTEAITFAVDCCAFGRFERGLVAHYSIDDRFYLSFIHCHISTQRFVTFKHVKTQCKIKTQNCFSIPFPYIPSIVLKITKVLSLLAQ